MDTIAHPDKYFLYHMFTNDYELYGSMVRKIFKKNYKTILAEIGYKIAVENKKLKNNDFYEIYRKYAIMEQMDLLRGIAKNNIAKLKLTEEGLYSITRPDQGMQFVDIFDTMITRTSVNLKHYTLIDGTAGFGGDLLYVSKYFANAIAYEINPKHAEAIKTNTSEYKIDVEVRNKNFLEEYKVLNKGTILWLDPPWVALTFGDGIILNCIFITEKVTAILTEFMLMILLKNVLHNQFRFVY